VSPCEDEGAESILLIRGKDWEGNPFILYANAAEAKSLFSQLNFYVWDGEEPPYVDNEGDFDDYDGDGNWGRSRRIP
jgi:hypothetical protein